MHEHDGARYRLASVLKLVLLVAAGGCGEAEITVTLSGILAEDDLDQIREENETDAARCSAACEDMLTGGGLYTVLFCTADACTVGDAPPSEVRTPCRTTSDPPWDPKHEAVQVTCELRDELETEDEDEDDGCSWLACGRRPHGHREAAVRTTDDVGEWFAAGAYLERASVTAFDELAGWLERHDAPAALVERCRAAALDEIRHADSMAELARQRGAVVHECGPDAPVEDLVAVAIHNAVEGCVHESFSAIIAAHQATHARDDFGRGTFAELAADELRHGQLAWDLNVWLLGQLDDDGRSAVALAQRNALAALPARVAATARVTPRGLGWPSPSLASTMARRFAALMAAA